MNPTRISLTVIALLGLINLGRGGIHAFAPDGGLKMIAGLDITAAPAIALSLIGAVGAGQIAFALVDLAAVALHRPFVRPLLLIHTVQQALVSFLLFVWRPFPQDVPGQWGALVALVVLGFFAALEYSRKENAPA
jgi:hypothetical protein